MIRTIVYPPSTAADTYGDKLLKYIPAEVIAFYVPVYAVIPHHNKWILSGILVLSIAATVGYLMVRADPNKPPRKHFYVLAAVAFVCWSLGTSSIGQDLAGLPTWANTIAVPFGVLLIPLIDEFIAKLPKKQRAVPASNVTLDRTG